tara:strand:+ start:231 stop:413 length:183 start_codon:yes stop_codon:yes gene_type:complete
MTTEQEVIDLFFPDDNTKTITDLIDYFKQLEIDNGWTDITETIVKDGLKDAFNQVSDWSF